ncbi:hypothetical protein COLO4_27439 [Corchorus olitorius]|uniref:Uncharacterized protein n=1 Tax=Corchorus olitorius TaxID=93759 RepID=A0A1R3HRD0_9ROSI|nr:hypothetical protein COLO4_27439 [Corchorus olitorius]
MFIATRKGKEGNELDEVTSEKITQLEEIQSQTQGQSSLAEERFNEVMEIERGGRVRLYGRGVMQKSLRKTVIDDVAAKVQQEQVNEDVQKRLDQHNSVLATGFQTALAALQQANPSWVIPTGIFDFLLNAHSPGDASSAQDRVSHEQIPSSSAMHNPS